MKVLYPKPFEPEVIDDLRSLVSPGIVIGGDGSAMPDCEVLIDGRASREELERYPHLKNVIVPFAGVPHATLDLLKEFPGITLHNLHHNAADTGELALALMLACARMIVPMDRRLRVGDWSPRYEISRAVRLEGKTALVLGYGHIGKVIARGCKGLGMDVLAIRKRTSGVENDGLAEIYSLERLADVLPRADVVAVALPQTAETTGLIGATELALLPIGAILVNIARGPIVDEQALYEALKGGTLHSAGIDVWYRYPNESAPTAVPGYFDMPEAALKTAPSDYPFQGLDNVVMSPHRGGTSGDSEALRVNALAEMLNAAARGVPMPNKVDLNTGY